MRILKKAFNNSRHAVWRSALVLFTVACCSPPGVTQERAIDFCDPALARPGDDPYRYQNRGDRCAGVYVQQVATSTLQIVSFGSILPSIDYQTVAHINIDWFNPGERDVHLRAEALRRRLYFRMDTVRSGGTSEFDWSTDLLSALGIDAQDLGIIAWVPAVVGGIQRNVYLPLRVSQSDSREESGRSFQVVLLPGRSLSEVFLSISRADTIGEVGEYIVEGQALGAGPYPAEWAIPIAITPPAGEGYYRFEIGATLSGGGTSALEAWFYHRVQ